MERYIPVQPVQLVKVLDSVQPVQLVKFLDKWKAPILRSQRRNFLNGGFDCIIQLIPCVFIIPRPPHLRSFLDALMKSKNGVNLYL